MGGSDLPPTAIPTPRARVSGLEMNLSSGSAAFAIAAPARSWNAPAGGLLQDLSRQEAPAGNPAGFGVAQP